MRSVFGLGGKPVEELAPGARDPYEFVPVSDMAIVQPRVFCEFALEHAKAAHVPDAIVLPGVSKFIDRGAEDQLHIRVADIAEAVSRAILVELKQVGREVESWQIARITDAITRSALESMRRCSLVGSIRNVLSVLYVHDDDEVRYARERVLRRCFGHERRDIRASVIDLSPAAKISAIHIGQ